MYNEDLSKIRYYSLGPGKLDTKYEVDEGGCGPMGSRLSAYIYGEWFFRLYFVKGRVSGNLQPST